jgi:hypothetical protein
MSFPQVLVDALRNNQDEDTATVISTATPTPPNSAASTNSNRVTPLGNRYFKSLSPPSTQGTYKVYTKTQHTKSNTTILLTTELGTKVNKKRPESGFETPKQKPNKLKRSGTVTLPNTPVANCDDEDDDDEDDDDDAEVKQINKDAVFLPEDHAGNNKPEHELDYVAQKTVKQWIKLDQPSSQLEEEITQFGTQ